MTTNGTATPQNSQALTPYQARALELREEIGQEATPRAIVPRTFAEAQAFASAISQSALVPDKLRERAPDVLMMILAGAEHGIAPIRALTLFHVVEGVPKLSADGIAAIVTAHPLCEYLEPVEQSDERVTWAAKKHGRPELRLTWDKAAATRAGLWGKRNWAGYPRQMLNARCKAELCRLVFPEITSGLVSVEEARDQIELAELQKETGGVPATLAAPPPPPAPAASSMPRDTSKQGDGTPAGGKGSKATKAKPPIDAQATEQSSSGSSSSQASTSSSNASASPSNSSTSATGSSASSGTPANEERPTVAATTNSTPQSTESSNSTEPAASATSTDAQPSPSSPASSSADAADDDGGFGGDESSSSEPTLEGFKAALAGATKETIDAVKAEWVPLSLKDKPLFPHAAEMRKLFAARRAELLK